MVSLTEPKHTARAVPRAGLYFVKHEQMHTHTYVHRVTQKCTFKRADACAHTQYKSVIRSAALNLLPQRQDFQCRRDSNVSVNHSVCCWLCSCETRTACWESVLHCSQFRLRLFLFLSDKPVWPYTYLHTHVNTNTHTCTYKWARGERWFQKEFSWPECPELRWVNTD